MVSKTISQLESAPAITGDMLTPVENGAATFAASIDAIKDYILQNESLFSILDNRNFIINGDFSVAQRGLSFTSASNPANNNDTYLLDRWNLLSDGNDIVDVSQELTEKPDGASASIQIDQETPNKKWGIVQILKSQDSEALIGGVASLSFEAKKGGSNATLEKLRAAIISWVGTKDAVTSDVIASWAGAGTNPTLAANWNYENTPSDLILTNSFQKFKIENVAIDSVSTKNIAVLIWLDDVNATVGDLAYISKIKLEYGFKASLYIPRLISEELALCRKHYRTSYENSTPAGSITAVGNLSFQNVIGNAFSARFSLQDMFYAPTLTVYSPNTGSSGKVREDIGSTDQNATISGTREVAGVQSLGSIASTAQVRFHYKAEAEL
jgi:hypothetical protein